MVTAAGRALPDAGFTLIELVVSMALLAIMMSASLYSILSGMRLSRYSQDRIVAAGVVQGVLQRLETAALTTAGFDAIPITTESLPSEVASGTTFSLSQTAEWVNRGVSSSVCNSGTNASLILKATVTASWAAGQQVSESTLLAPPNGTFSPGDGSLPVQVDSSSGAGLAGATVTATNSGHSSSIVTGSDGCAFFAQLSPGTYTVTVSASGGVDSLEQPSFTTTVPVDAGEETSQLIGSGAIYYDQGATLNWSFSPTSPPPAQGMPISVHPTSSQGLTDDMYSWPGGVSTSGSVYPVYPDGYGVFAGECTDSDPLGLNSNLQPFYPGASTTNVVLSRGTTSSVAVPLYPLNLQVTASGLAPSAINSPAGGAPSAVPGATGETGGAACPYLSSTYTLSPVVNGASSTGVGLGHLAITVSIPVTKGGVATTLTGTVDVWVRPDGVYAVDSNGNATTEYYSFATGGSVPVTVS